MTQESLTMAEVVSLLTPLPPANTSDPPPDVPIGTVVLFRDPWWTSEQVALNIYEISEGKRQYVPKWFDDVASWALFKLPIGVVFTLLADNEQYPPDGNVADLSGCDRTVDLVGTSSSTAESSIFRTPEILCNKPEMSAWLVEQPHRQV